MILQRSRPRCAHWSGATGPRNGRPKPRRDIMPTIARIGSIQIRIYYDDHGVPHFHAVSPEFDFKFAIATCATISGSGSIRGRDLAAIRAWDNGTATGYI